MFEKNLQIGYLLDFYGDVLDEHTKSVMEAYYDDDLSLAEIASGENISRQGIRHIIKRGEEQLVFLEDRLGLLKKHECLSDYSEKLLAVEHKLTSFGEDEDALIIREVIEQITDKGI